MTEKRERQSSVITNTFLSAVQAELSQHGYGFQYRVSREIQTLVDTLTRQSKWSLEAVEFPVEVKNHTSRIDLVLRHPTSGHYLLIECKRANPAIANWCFVRGPYQGRALDREQYLVDSVIRDGHGSVGAAMDSITTYPHYHVGFEVDTQKLGDPHGKGRGAIEDAVGQCMRASSGFIGFLASHKSTFPSGRTVRLLTAVVTTAALWTVDVDLSQADLSDGRLELTSESITKSPWLLLQYHRSPALRHTLPTHEGITDLPLAMQWDFVRTVAIVSSSGLRDFLLQTADMLKCERSR